MYLVSIEEIGREEVTEVRDYINIIIIIDNIYTTR